MYSCKTCIYKTNDKKNYVRHISSNKHCVKSRYYCEKCFSYFTKKSSLNRHNKTIHEMETKNEIIKEYEKQILVEQYERKLFEQKMATEYEIKLTNKILETERKISDQQLETERKLLEAEKKISEHKEIINNKLVSFLVEDRKHDRMVIRSSMNALNFVKSNFTNAPVIHYFDIKDSLFFENGYSKGDVILYLYRNKNIIKYIGEILLKEYKKDNPLEQSIWSSDVVRKNMLLNKMVNNKPKWSQDKSGHQTASYLIDPIIKTIKDNISQFQYLREYDILDKEKCEKYELANKLEKSINNNDFRNEIIAYISPRIYLDKNTIDGKNITKNDCNNRITMEEITDTKENKINEKKKKGRPKKNKEEIKIEEIKKEENIFIKNNKKANKNKKDNENKKKIYDKNGVTISSESESLVDSDELLEAIIGRKLNKEKIYGPGGKNK
jgi:hypothetical protein